MVKKNVVVKARPIEEGGIRISCGKVSKSGLNTIEAFIFLAGLLRKERNVKIKMEVPMNPHLAGFWAQGIHMAELQKKTSRRSSLGKSWGFPSL